jgi:hypothetical protein
MSIVVYTTDQRAHVPLPHERTFYNAAWQVASAAVALSSIAGAGAVFTEKCRPLISRVVTYSLCSAISLLSLTALYLLRQLDRFVNERGDRPLHIAVRDNDEQSVGWLLFFGANPNAQRCNGFTPLHIAAENTASEEIELRLMHELMGYGANVNATSTEKEVPLHRAAATYCAEKVQLLLNYAAMKKTENSHQQTPLALAQSGAEEWNSKKEQAIKIVQMLVD